MIVEIMHLSEPRKRKEKHLGGMRVDGPDEDL
jgi:hypothetical protein